MIVHLTVTFLGGWCRLKQRCAPGRPSFPWPASRLLYWAYQRVNGASITRFASEPRLPHGPARIFTSYGACIGANTVVIRWGTSGSNILSHSGLVGVPTIGGSYIGAGAKIVANMGVGHNVRVGANAVVHGDVPDNAVVTLGGFRVRRTPGRNRFYFRQRQGLMYFEDGTWAAERAPGALDLLNGPSGGPDREASSDTHDGPGCLGGARG